MTIEYFSYFKLKKKKNAPQIISNKKSIRLIDFHAIVLIGACIRPILSISFSFIFGAIFFLSFLFVLHRYRLFTVKPIIWLMFSTLLSIFFFSRSSLLAHIQLHAINVIAFCVLLSFNRNSSQPSSTATATYLQRILYSTISFR